jgi:putative dehydrogenase
MSEAEMTVGIIGLGIMGGAFAKNLLANGFEVAGCDPSDAAREKSTAIGVAVHTDVGPWLLDCNPVIISVASPKVLHAVTTALADILTPNQIVIETGTFSLADKMQVYETLKNAGISALDCPLSGTGAQAAVADLVMMASGDKAALESCRDALEAFTKKIIYAGDYGAGIKMKYVANHAVVIHNCAAAETLAYARKIGLDQETVYQMLSSGAGQSKMSDLRMPLMMQDAYTPATASLAIFEKDISIIGANIQEAGAMTPLFEACSALYQTAVATVPMDYDSAAVFEVFRNAETPKL